jgi:cysteine desulfurase
LKKKLPIYLDNASTTPVHDDVLLEMLPYFKEKFGNPSAMNLHSLEPKSAINHARTQVSKLLNCNDDQIIFNSGSTESINHVLKSSFFSGFQAGKNQLVVSAIEHKAVLEVADYLKTIGCKVTKVGVDSNGVIDLEELSQSLTDKTFLVCVMLVNNETGVIQPLNEVVYISKEKGIPVFTDATPAVGKMEVDVTDLGVDYLCLSAHKISGPKGVGALYCQNPNLLEPLLHGGSQEKSKRGGTYNVPGIVGLGKASEIALRELESRISFYKKKKEKILAEVIGADAVENFQDSPKVENIMSLTLKNEENEEYLSKQRNRFSASTGSACTAEIIQDSHVLRAIPGVEPKKVIRISI